LVERLNNTFLLARKDLACVVAKLALCGYGCRDGMFRTAGVIEALLKLGTITTDYFLEYLRGPLGEPTRILIKPKSSMNDVRRRRKWRHSFAADL